MESYKQEFIEFMIRSNVLSFGDFITKSGRSTPFFVNTGNYRTGSQIKRLGEFYARAIKEKIGMNFDVLFGPAYKGIPLVVAVSIALKDLYDKDAAFCFNRKEKKDHGEGGILIGHPLTREDRVLIVEDVTTAGTSIEETLPIIRSRGVLHVEGLIVSVDRMEKGKTDRSALNQIKELHGFKTESIVTMNEIRTYLLNRPVDGVIVMDDAMNERIDAYYAIYGARD